MEEMSKEDLEQIKDVFSQYKDGFESGTIIRGVLLTIGEPNKNDDVFIMPTQQEVQVFYDNGLKSTKCIQAPPMKIGEPIIDSRRVVIEKTLSNKYSGIGFDKFGSGNYTESVTLNSGKVWRKPDDKQSNG